VPRDHLDPQALPRTPSGPDRAGSLKVCIWRNTGHGGQVYYTAKQGDGTWKETDSLNADDLLAKAE
jgi:hypothetical protein